MGEKNPDESEIRLNKIFFTDEVQNAIGQVLKSADSLDLSDFNSIEYINQLFPNEQSLSNIDDVIAKMECEISVCDDNIRYVVRGQTNTGQDGRIALEEAQKIIKELFLQITNIKTCAEKTEEMVKEITCDIKQLDRAKKNLTSAITTLNHLHMLCGGVYSLNKLIEKRLYGEILNPLQAITEVNQHFQQYNEIPQIKNLSDKVQQIENELATQITSDFRNVFSITPVNIGTGNNYKMSITQLTEACKVVTVLDPKVKRDLLKWFLKLQLEEYIQLFHENQDIAWLDKIDKRYAWLKRMLLDFEIKYEKIFPISWEISERIAIEFCLITRQELSSIMLKRRHEIDCKLLLYAITKTQQFEQLLSKRFTGITFNEHFNNNIEGKLSDFNNLIGICFKAHLDIYTNSIDNNLNELLERFIEFNKQPFNPFESKSAIFSSCADLFVFYKKCMVQCTQLCTGKPMLDLSLIFKKYLREYSQKILEVSIPKITLQTSIGTSMSLLTRDLQNLSSAAGQVIHNFLKEGETPRFTKDELIRICCVLTTAEYCLETVQQLEDKLKEKIDKTFIDKIDLSDEKDIFHTIISTCIQLLVQDLENGCEPALNVMSKIQWQNINNVGDQSSFIDSLTIHFKSTIPIIRDNLSSSRKYYTQFCYKFINTFIPKYINTLFKCRLIQNDTTSLAATTHLANSMNNNNNLLVTNSNNILGCEQLLLDTHSLKIVLLDLPSILSNIKRKSPTTYTKCVVKGMQRAEMLIKLCMTPIHSKFVEQCFKLITDLTLLEYQKILEMKCIKRIDQVQLIEQFKKTLSRQLREHGNEEQPKQNVLGRIKEKQNNEKLPNSENYDNSSTLTNSGIKKLENLIKKRLPN